LLQASRAAQPAVWGTGMPGVLEGHVALMNGCAMVTMVVYIVRLLVIDSSWYRVKIFRNAEDRAPSVAIDVDKLIRKEMTSLRYTTILQLQIFINYLK
jgi:hypothetical protein